MTKTKFRLGDTEDLKKLKEIVDEKSPDPRERHISDKATEDQIFRVRRNMEIRIRNHLHEIRKNEEEVKDCRDRLRIANISDIKSVSGQVEATIEADRLGIRIKDLSKWMRHLRADVKFLNRQKDLLGFENRNGTDKG